jgi:HPt (histidine-containing phosphotransfer) domain-containing protein
MYYITNQANQIIATDRSLLELLSVQNIDELYTKIALGEISFSSVSDEEVTIATTLNKNSYPIQTFTLQGILGEMNLTQISVEESLEEDTSLDESPVLPSKEDHEILSDEISEETNSELPLDDAPLLIDDNSFLKTDTESETSEETLDLDEENETISLLDTDTINLNEESPDTEVNTQSENIEFSEDSELFDLLSSDAKEESEEEIKQDTGPIIIDVDTISKEIGISTEDYDNFLNEYIDTALKLEDDLKGDQEEKHSQAITTLSHLSNVLHLPMITQIITNIENNTTDLDKEQPIHDLYSTLTRLTTNKNISILPMDDLPAVEKEITSIDVSPPTSFGSIDLSNIKPIHFDFRLEEAANDLSLPVELIEEFVHDFIEQAHTETKNMLKAYEKGDLDAIQKIGHMLKGASSNLRIKALSETLYKIQFCEKSNEIEDLIKDYWGHFLAFETQINLTSQ